MGDTKLGISPSTAFIRRDWTFHFFMGWLVFLLLFSFVTSFSYIPHRHFFYIIDRSRWFCYLFSKSCSSVYFLHSFCWLSAWLFLSLICFDTMCAFGGISFLLIYTLHFSPWPLLTLSWSFLESISLCQIFLLLHILTILCDSFVPACFMFFALAPGGIYPFFSFSTCTFLYLTCSWVGPPLVMVLGFAPCNIAFMARSQSYTYVQHPFIYSSITTNSLRQQFLGFHWSHHDKRSLSNLIQQHQLPMMVEQDDT